VRESEWEKAIEGDREKGVESEKRGGWVDKIECVREYVFV